MRGGRIVIADAGERGAGTAVRGAGHPLIRPK